MHVLRPEAAGRRAADRQLRRAPAAPRRPTALAIFASDAISSTAYATEEILLVLVPVVGMVALNTLVPISIVVAILLAIVITSYRQTIYAYPNGGGSYVVSRENLGVGASLVAGASVMVDYILTVAVSISAGVAAITSAFARAAPVPHRALPGRPAADDAGQPPRHQGVRQDLLAARLHLRGEPHDPDRVRPVRGLRPGPRRRCRSTRRRSRRSRVNTGPDGSPIFTGITVLLLLRAFSSGAVALTGVEAISNGVPAFKKPESHNAATTLMAMGGILGAAFIGLSVLAHNLQPTVSENETLLSTMARYLYEDGTSSIGSIGVVLYYVLQFSTFAILILAANTAFAAFPHVSSIIAADGYLPRQLSNRGDRLVFSNGILVLTLVAGAAHRRLRRRHQRADPALRRRRVHRLHPLPDRHGDPPRQGAGEGLASQPGRQRAWARWPPFIVLVVVVVSKFTYGAWIPVVLIPVIVVFFRSIHKPLRPGRAGPRGAGRLPLTPPPPHGHRAGRPGAPRRARRPHLRPVPGARPPHRPDDRPRRRSSRS